MVDDDGKRGGDAQQVDFVEAVTAGRNTGRQPGGPVTAGLLTAGLLTASGVPGRYANVNVKNLSWPPGTGSSIIGGKASR